MGCRRYREYDLATNAWATPKFPFDNAAGYNSDGAKGYTGENMQAWFDEVERRYYVCATQNSGASQTWSVQPGGAGWRWEGGYPIRGYESFYTAQEKRNRTLWTLVYDTVNNRMGSPRVMLETRLDSLARRPSPSGLVLPSERGVWRQQLLGRAGDDLRA
jgi:hypothetical protein